MIKRYALALILIAISVVMVCQPADAKENQAQTIPNETSVSKKLIHLHRKKGDLLSVIIRHIPGITEKDISNNYKLIKELNPHIPNLNKLEAGQSLILPGKPIMEEDLKTETKIKNRRER